MILRSITMPHPMCLKNEKRRQKLGENTLSSSSVCLHLSVFICLSSYTRMKRQTTRSLMQSVMRIDSSSMTHCQQWCVQQAQAEASLVYHHQISLVSIHSSTYHYHLSQLSTYKSTNHHQLSLTNHYHLSMLSIYPSTTHHHLLLLSIHPSIIVVHSLARKRDPSAQGQQKSV